MKRNILRNLFAAIAALLIATFALPTAVQAQKLTIDDNEMDLSTSADLMGDWLESGKVHWDKDTRTLTLDNATLVSKKNPLNFITLQGSFVLHLIGSNSITATKYTALWGSKVTINGGGSLKVMAPEVAFYILYQIKIEDCKVETDQKSYSNKTGDLTVKNATMKSGAIYGLKSINLEGCKIEVPAGGNIGGDNGSKKIVDADGKLASKVSIVPVFSDKIGAGGYATFAAADKPGTLSGNVELYTGTVSGDKLTLVPRTDKNLPAGAFVVLKGTAGETFTFTPDAAVSAAPMPEDNVLTGGATAYTVADGDNIFAIATIDGTTAFYRVNAGVEIPAHKAYIRLTTVDSKALKVIAIGGEPTGISTLTAEGAKAAVYNLAGRRVGKDHKGIVIVNGKKIIRK